MPRQREKESHKLPLWLEMPLVIVVAVLLAFAVKTFLVQIFYIPSGSMENTLLVGDRVAVNRLAYRLGEPARGDVIVFDGVDSFVPADQAPPSEGPIEGLLTELGRTVGVVPPPDTVFVKRVIGVGGDRVVCCDDKGRIEVNGQPIGEPYLYPGDKPSSTRFDVKVPQGKLWVMGDHRSASADSRAHMGEPGGGFVPVDRALGRAFAVIWPQAQWQMLSTPPWAEKLNQESPNS
ncbi:MAG: signal peptidase I [Candidatus Nanopelagicales bacterium]